jgi:hypothetical protein
MCLVVLSEQRHARAGCCGEVRLHVQAAAPFLRCASGAARLEAEGASGNWHRDHREITRAGRVVSGDGRWLRMDLTLYNG